MPKTFQDLEFSDHPLGGTNAYLTFPNGYGISVIGGNDKFYCGPGTFEVAITKDNNLCYDTEFTNNVLSYQSIDDIDKLLVNIEKL